MRPLVWLYPTTSNAVSIHGQTATLGRQLHETGSPGHLRASKCRDISRLWTKRLDVIFEHWVHFHMHEGRCFVAPCCQRGAMSATSRWKNQTFPSITDAADHLVREHCSEMEERRLELRVIHKCQEVGSRRSYDEDEDD